MPKSPTVSCSVSVPHPERFLWASAFIPQVLEHWKLRIHSCPPPELSTADGKHLTWGGDSQVFLLRAAHSHDWLVSVPSRPLAGRWCDGLSPETKCTVFFPTPILQFSNTSWVSNNSFNSDTNSPEPDSRLKGSAPQDCPYFRGQLQMGCPGRPHFCLAYYKRRGCHDPPEVDSLLEWCTGECFTYSCWFIINATTQE